jgi:hypothetical protein
LSKQSSLSRAKLVSSAAVCAALYALLDAATSTLHTPWGVGEFRPGVVVPAFFAIVVGPIPAAVGAAVGSFVADMVSLVPSGGSTPLLAAVAGAPANFIGFLIIGYVFQRLKNWKGFILGTTTGLIVGNLWAAAFVVYLVGLPQSFILGLLLFWFGTMFPFVVIFVPALVKYLRPYASQLVAGRPYPIITQPSKRVLWTWSIVVAALVLAAMGVLLAFQTGLVSSSPGGALAWELLFGISAAAVLVVGAFIPTSVQKANVAPKLEN